jgi:2-polyprenyl-6-methoxyphenol hydroxylase-like FAD-dependent oxidoreductase
VDQSAYRSELTGQYGIACTIWHLEQEYHAKGKITVGCDGLSALRQAQKRIDFSNPNIPQHDLILAIHTVIEKTNWKWEWIHVKGHQDEIMSNDELDIWSRWNIQMDSQAKEFWAASGNILYKSNYLGGTMANRNRG